MERSDECRSTHPEIDRWTCEHDPGLPGVSSSNPSIGRVVEDSRANKTPAGQPAPPPSNPQMKAGRLRALYERLRGGSSAGASSAKLALGPQSPDAIPARIGRYVITRKLGQGGMGVVYAARDERLGRSVAIQMLSSLANDDTGRRRLWREARAAARINHPNVCQLYEVGEVGGELFIAMEHLEGETLSERLRRGALSVAETIPIGLDMLAALSALHALGFVHRDLKPSNAFLTPHGVKLLDFGLARPIDAAAAEALGADADLTRSGLVMGTPRYMAPEQISGEPFDARSDLFAVGAILFEMLAGRPAFEGRNVVEILHATLHEQPPALTGSPAIAAVDRVIRRALAKKPAERPESADVMAAEMRAVQGTDGDNTRALARPLTRLVVLPFRVLRSDPETDFLAFSLPDAIATSLSGFDSLVVRSSALAARFDRESPDLKALAAEADVDLVVMGTLLRSGDELRAAAQLVEAPAGTLLASHTVQSSLGDLFRLQDDVAQRVVQVLSLPLSGRGARLAADTPRSARAYEFYLRGNDMARTYEQVRVARDLYLQCVEQDPSFAPAWAHLGRSYLVIGKYIEDATGNYPRCEEALHRALELSPDLPVAHKFYAHLEADIGKAPQAMVRLLGQAAKRRNDPDLFAGLVHVCRYCGLFEQSIAAHEEARRLDPNVPTSIEQTFLFAGETDRVLQVTRSGNPVRVVALGMASRNDDAHRELLELQESSAIPAYRVWKDWLTAWVGDNRETLLERMSELDQLTDIRIGSDPEALFQEGWELCQFGEHELGLARLQRGVAGGFVAALTLAHSPHFDALRGDTRFKELMSVAEERREQALTAFRDAGGESLLGK
jgi:non-specific serine/threonine protein kinase